MREEVGLEDGLLLRQVGDDHLGDVRVRPHVVELERAVPSLITFLPGERLDAGFLGSRESVSGRIVCGAAARRSMKALLPGVVRTVSPFAM